MQVKLNKKEMENLNIQMNQNTEDLYYEIDNCIEDIKRIKEAYKSIESKYVLETFELYLEKLKQIPNTYDGLTKFIKKAGNTYRESDESFKNELQKENADDYEDLDSEKFKLTEEDDNSSF